MPTERHSRHYQKDSPPADQHLAGDGQYESAANGGGERSGLKAKLAANLKWNRRKTDDTEKKRQLQDYAAWVNNYLKRRPGMPLITDLRTGIQDGTTIVHLVEIVAHVELHDIDHYPTTSTARRNNIEKTLSFLRVDGVMLHQEALRDILEGNSKGIMRVILALAERYQPRSVKQRSVSDPKPYVVAQHHHSSPVHHNQRDHTPPDRFSSTPRGAGGGGDHMTFAGGERPPPIVPRTRSPDEIRPRAQNLKSFSSLTAANSFSVPNMASLNVHAQHPSRSGGGGVPIPNPHSTSTSSVRPVPGRRSYDQSNMGHAQGYGPPQIGQGALSQPERLMRSAQNEDIQVQTRTYSLSQADMENEVYSTPVDQLPPSAGTRIIAPQKKLGVQIRVRSGSTSFHSIPEESEFHSMGEGGVAASHRMSLADSGISHDMDAVVVGLSQFKNELLQLHALLLRNGKEKEQDTPSHQRGHPVVEDVDSAPTPTPTSGSMNPAPVEPLVTAAAVNAMAFHEKNQPFAEKDVQIVGLQDQLAQLQDEYTQLDSECAALRNMVEERNTFITSIKSEIYRKEYKNDTQRVDLHQQLFQKESVIKKLENELVSFRGSLEEHQQMVESAQAEVEDKERSELEMKVEMELMREELERLRCSEDTLQSRVAGKDKRIAHLEEKVTDLKEARTRRAETVSEEADGIRESLSQLRQSIPAQDSQQAAIDQLEKYISELMSKLVERSSSPSGKKSRRHRDYEDHHRDKEKRRRHREKHSQYVELHSAELDPQMASTSTNTAVSAAAAAPNRQSSSPVTVGGANSGTSPTPGEGTKVIYYMLGDKKETPYSTVVAKKSNEVTLRDFKAAFSRHGSFRYYIKVEDPDCGVVKEEVKKDEKLLPSWNGKILVWVAEKPHHR